MVRADHTFYQTARTDFDTLLPTREKASTLYSSSMSSRRVREDYYSRRRPRDFRKQRTLYMGSVIENDVIRRPTNFQIVVCHS